MHDRLPTRLTALLVFAALANTLAAQTGPATYELTFTPTWSAATHPTNFPSRPHFSQLIGATHDASTVFWQPGSLATPGIQSVAETGATATFRSEIRAAVRAGGADQELLGSGIASPGSTSISFRATPQHPQLTMVTMLAPSPDWFVGVHGLALAENGVWIDELSVSLHVYDAGTDSGTTYSAPNQPTVPAQPIALAADVFSNSRGRCIGTFRLARTDRPRSGVAIYDVTFQSTWSAQTHPTGFPSNPHFSPFVGTTHDGTPVFWEPGCLASRGIQDVAERGSTANLASEMNRAIQAGTAYQVFTSAGIASPASTTFEVRTTRTFPLVSLVSMLAPSPDWFVGVSGLSLIRDGQWIDSIVVPVQVYDAGTDSGVDYRSPNAPTNPPSAIDEVTTASGPFQNHSTTIGTIRFERRASTLVYGSGVNPSDSLTVAGWPRLGLTTTLSLDDPTGTSSAPATSVVAFAFAPSARFPTGLSVPGLGLGGGAGEFLLDAPFAAVPGPSWNGAPAAWPLAIPADPGLVGVRIYAQGALVDANARAGLTDAVELRIGN